MSNKPTPDKLRATVERELGIITTQHQRGKRKTVRPKPYIKPIKKTPLMKYLEQRYNVTFPDILLTGSLSVVAHSLGDEVDTSTVSRWIKRCNLRYSEDNLPSCDGCRQYKPQCDGGVCDILLNLELYELVMVKRNEILERVS